MRPYVPIFGLTLVWTLCVAVDARAQQPAPPAQVALDERSAYDAGGRRDPFLSLTSRGDALPNGGVRPLGVKGLLIAELSLRGVVRSGERFLGMVEGPDKRTYTITAGEQLFDGTVRVVTADAVVFLQQVTDPLSPVKQREIRKTLRTTEENR
jgi:Tfp pilus assembly protein PilP